MKPQIVRLVQGLKVTVLANLICMLDIVKTYHRPKTKESKSDLWTSFILAKSNNSQDANTLAASCWNILQCLAPLEWTG